MAPEWVWPRRTREKCQGVVALNVSPRGVVTTGVGVQPGVEVVDRGFGRERPVAAVEHVPGFGEREQGRQRGRARRKRGVEVEPGEVVEDVQRAVPGVVEDRQRHAVGGVGDEPTGMAEDESDVGVATPNAVAHQQKRRPGGVEQEIRGEGRDAGHGGRGQVGRVDERDGRALVQDAEEFVLPFFTQVGARRVAQQHDTVGVQVIEGAPGLGGGRADVGQGKGGEEPEPVGFGVRERGGVVVERPCQCGRLCGIGQEGGAGSRDRQHRRGDPGLR